MRRRDVFLIAGIILFVILCFFLRGIFYHGRAAYVEISQDGSILCRLRLSAQEEQEIRIDSADGGYNLVHIENGSVFVRKADCENHDCIRQGAIWHTGESIICLPHKLTITIVGEQGILDTSGDEQYDTIVR